MARLHGSSSRALDLYLAEIRQRAGGLSRERERQLGLAIRHGADDAVGEMVRSNLGFVVKVAMEYRGLGLPFEDLLNEGNIGLIDAACRFDPERKTKFVTYAAWWVRKSILQALVSQSSLVRVPGHRRRKIREIREAESTLERELGRRPLREELSARLSRKLSKLDEELQTPQHTMSLEDKVGTNSEVRIEDLLHDESAPLAEEELIRREAVRSLGNAMALLTHQELVVLTYRYGLLGQPPETLEQIGRRLGTSRERIRQVENKAKRRLRRYLRRRNAKRSPSRGPLPSMFVSGGGNRGS